MTTSYISTSIQALLDEQDRAARTVREMADLRALAHQYSPARFSELAGLAMPDVAAVSARTLGLDMKVGASMELAHSLNAARDEALALIGRIPREAEELLKPLTVAARDASLTSEMDREMQRQADAAMRRPTVADLANAAGIAGFVGTSTRSESAAWLDRESIGQRLQGLESISVAAKLFEEFSKPIGWTNLSEITDPRRALASHRLHLFGDEAALATSMIAQMEAARTSVQALLGYMQEAEPIGFALDEPDIRLVDDVVRRIIDAPRTEQVPVTATRALVDAIETQPNPATRALLRLIGWKVLELCFVAVITFAGVHYSVALQRQEARAIKKGVAEISILHPDYAALLAERRYVDAEFLEIHLNPKALSPVLATITLGMHVRLLKVEKDFAFVEWTDKQSAVIVNGWVFARHLRKFQ